MPGQNQPARDQGNNNQGGQQWNFPESSRGRSPERKESQAVRRKSPTGGKSPGGGGSPKRRHS